MVGLLKWYKHVYAISSHFLHSNMLLGHCFDLLNPILFFCCPLEFLQRVARVTFAQENGPANLTELPGRDSAVLKDQPVRK